MTATNPVTVSADGLPTAQINGVGWAQAVVGTTVYVGGAFTSARPAGSPAGTDETPRSNVLSYDITTGILTSWAPNVNGQVLTVAASPDGSRIYIGGDFTSVDGQTRNRVAAFDTATGTLLAAWHPNINSQVRAIAATSGTVYLGGSITAVGGVSRSRLAAVTAAEGTLLPWAPLPGVGPTDGNRDGNTATSDQVLGLVVTSGGVQVVASGRFDSMNAVKATGVAALDATTGATRPYAINQLLLNQGINSAVYSLYTDGSVVIGTGYDFYGPGNLEGSFTVAADTGNVIAINDCHGDSYGTYATGGVVYFASHEHDCSNIGGFPEQSPRQNRFATAQTLAPTGTVGPFNLRSDGFYGKPAPSELDWFPIMKAGTVTGQDQAGWSVTGTGQYVAYAGEFGQVNGVDQQGLVRYAMPSIAPNKVGPTFADFTLAVDAPSAGSARIQWYASSDPDNENLTYRVYRDTTSSTPLYTTTQKSSWWNRPAMSFTDTAATSASQYRVTVTDPFGNQAYTPWTTISTTATPTSRAYVDAVLHDGATELWSLGEPAGTPTANGAHGLAPLLLGSGVTPGVPGALATDANTAYSFDGTTNGVLSLPFNFQEPETSTVEAWLQTTTTAGGELFGFGDAQTGDSTVTDRAVTMDKGGALTFSVNVAGVKKTVTTASAYNDGTWHYVAATLSPAGMFLYVDGGLVAARYDTPAGLTDTGYFRVGGDAGSYLAGNLDEVAIYVSAPSPDRIQAHYALGAGAAGNHAPTAAFTTRSTGLAISVDGSASKDSDGAVASYSWSFGDGSTGTGATVTHPYAAAGTYAVTLTVTDDKGATGSTAQLVTASPANAAPTAAFTSTAAGRAVSVDGSGSTDPDGTVASYSWNWGDTTPPGTGATATHTYAADGTYPVTLTVNDNQGGTGTVSHPVTVTGGAAVLAEDTFNRTGTGGLGTATTGGAWTASTGAARQSVAAGVAILALDSANQNTGSYLGSVAQTSADLTASFALMAMPTGNGTYVYLTGRRVANQGEYRVRVRLLANGTVGLALSRLVGTTEAFPNGETVVPGLAFAAGQTINAHLQVDGTGTTTVRARLWTTGAEPTTWQLTRTDTTAALQTSGAVGITVHRPAGTTAVTNVQFRSFRVTPVGAGTPANAAPSASFTATPNGLAVSVNGTASSDPDGTIASYAWNWGDTTPAGSGSTATHSYPAAGTYPVTLTVTDNGGAVGTTTQSVTVTTAGPAAIASDTFNRTVTGGLGTASLGGAWTASAGATRQSVTPGVAEMRLDAANQNTGSYLGGVSQTGADVRTTVVVTTTPTGNGTYVYVTGRRVANQGEYRVRVRLLANGTVGLALSRLVGTTETFPNGEVVVPGLTYTAGQTLNVHLQVFGTGTTTVRASIWTTGTEPATWQLTRTDTTAALQVAGGLGLAVHRPSGTTAATAVRFTGFTVTAAQ